MKSPITRDSWHVDSGYNLSKDRLWRHGSAHYGVHDVRGNTIYIGPDQNLIGCLNPDDTFAWCLGANNTVKAHKHFPMRLIYPNAVHCCKDGSLLIVSNGNTVYRADIDKEMIRRLIIAEQYGIQDISGCTCDQQGNIWISETMGCRIWMFSEQGIPILSLGSGKHGFQAEMVGYDKVEFGRIACIQCESENNIMIMDSGN